MNWKPYKGLLMRRLAKQSTKEKVDKSDIRPDARERFERAVDIAVATKPIRKEAKPKRGR